MAEENSVKNGGFGRLWFGMFVETNVVVSQREGESEIVKLVRE